MATLASPASRQARTTRTAISPRLAMRTLRTPLASRFGGRCSPRGSYRSLAFRGQSLAIAMINNRVASCEMSYLSGVVNFGYYAFGHVDDAPDDSRPGEVDAAGARI